MKQKFLLLFACLLCTVSAWADVVITYTSTDHMKIEPEGTNPFGEGVSFENTYTYDDTNDFGTITLTGDFTTISIADKAFSSSSLKTITLPDCVTSIGKEAFQFCSKLVSINIPKGVTQISEDTFYGCKNLKNVNFEGNIELIGTRAFMSCKVLDLTLPNSLKHIGELAFYETAITKAYISASVESIGETAFDKTNSLEYFEVAEENTYFTTTKDISDSKGHCLINKHEEGKSTVLLSFAPAGLTGDSYTIPYIPEGDNKIIIDEIGEYAFAGCINLRSIVIPSSVKKIDSYAFMDCTSLQSITLPSKITSIATQTFKECSSLTSITIPEGVTTIGEEAFMSCSELSSVIIPSTVSAIYPRAFQESNKLNNVTIYATDVPTLGSGAIPVNSYIFVPADKVVDYQTTWSDHDSHIQAISHTLKENVAYTNNISVCSMVTYSRTFEKNCWQALFLPFEVTEKEWQNAIEEYAVLAAYDADNKVLTWEKKTSGDMAAGTPYIVKPKIPEGESSVTLAINGQKGLEANTVKEVELPGGEITVTGTYAEKNMKAADGYLYWGMYDGEFYYTNEAKTLKPFRFFLTTEAPASEPAITDPAPAPIRINVVGTGIENPEGDGPTSIDGLVIDGVDDAPAFNLHGQRVGADYKGIVIVNGRKVVRR